MEKIEKTLKDLGGENLYAILGIEKTDEETRVQKGYKKMIKKYHPDKNKDPGALEIFSKVKKAIEILKDPDLKALYDSYLGRKEERQNKKKEYNKERRRFADDLKEREAKGNTRPEKEKTSTTISRMSQQINVDNEIVKKKTFEEKLQSTGVKIKWKKDNDVLITKEMIYSYFKDYGSIEDIQLKEAASKAYILFLSLKSVDLVVNDNSNFNLRKLFKVKKFSSKNKDQNEYEKEKFKYLDTNTLNAIRNYNQSTRINEKTPDQPVRVLTSTSVPNELIDFSKLPPFEEFERQVLDKLRSKFNRI
jgi:curved DNA-binding protein CbpA